LTLLQTELAINTNVVVSDTHVAVSNTHVVVSDTHVAVSSTHVVVSDTHAVVSDAHAMISDLHRNALTRQEGSDGQDRSVSGFLSINSGMFTIPQTQHRSAISNTMRSTVSRISRIPPGECPPPPPACFGRTELIEKIVGLAENFTPIALIGAGGIGKTSIALTLLHDDRIKKRFGENRRFIRCDKFPSTLPNFLRRLSDVIGAGVNNPEDLAPLRPFLSSNKMFLILDNAESILDPQGTNAQEVNTVVEELSQFKTVCLCITSRITTVPRRCKRPIIPTLSAEAAHDIFYDIYSNNNQSDIINNLLERLDYHALSITLLATTASHNMWDHDRLAKEWDIHRTQVLQTDYNESLAATIELSLTSPMFHKLGPNAHGLLGVIAFFPQGVDDSKIDWLFPTISNTQNIIDKFCTLSLTYRSNGFTTMLAPLRDYLCPKDPTLFPLLCTTKESYFSWLSVDVNPGKPGFEESKWIISEDVNVEHLLDVFTSTDANLDGVWDTCASFLRHLFWHKPRPVILGPKIEGLPDNQPSKPECLWELSRLFRSVGNYVEYKRLLIHTLELWRGQGNKVQVALTLEQLAKANQFLCIYAEGIQQVEESLGIFKQLNHTVGQANSLLQLARLLHANNQLGAAEEAASQSINFLPDKNEQFRVCQGYDLLGDICYSKGETEKAINHYKTALGIASSSNWDNKKFWILYSLAKAVFDQGRFGEAHAHIECAKSHAANDPFILGRAMEQQAMFWYKEGKLEEARSEALCAAGVFEKLGAVKGMEACRKILQEIEKDEKAGYIS
jgi:tetratricopeptide (TPR) repeat protein